MPIMDHVLRLIDDIYAAGAQPERWATALAGLANATGSDEATLGGQTAARVMIQVSSNTDPDFVRSYSEYYYRHNPMQAATFLQPIGVPMLDTMMLDLDQFHTTEFFNDWCRPQGFLSGASVNVAAADGWRATIMVTGRNSPGEAELEVLRIVAPHLCRAFQLNQALHETQTLQLGALAALEHVNKGAFVIDRSNVARAVNGLAERILARADGLFLREGRLEGANAADTRAIDGAVARCLRELPEGSGAAVSIGRGPGRSPLDLLCIPFPTTSWWPGFENHLALVLVTDREANLESKALRMRMRYGLTQAEADLAWEIVRSGGRKEAAAHRGVSVATVRSQLTSIFDKTGARRQADLVRLILEDSD